jgi:hypothetical protein
MGIVTFGSDAGTDLLEVIFVLLAAALVLFIGVQIPLWWLRLRRGFQLQLPGKGALESGIGETQFSLRQLLVTTTIVALALGAGRMLAATINWDASGGQQQIHWEPFLFFGLILVFSIGVVWLDKNSRVVDKQLAKPWRPMYTPKSPAQYYIEANPSVLDRVRVGSKLRFDEAV